MEKDVCYVLLAVMAIKLARHHPLAGLVATAWKIEILIAPNPLSFYCSLFIHLQRAGICTFHSGECAQGYYCPEGSTRLRQLACPGGKYGASVGLSSSECSGPSHAGYYAPVASTSPKPFRCSTKPNLYYCPLGTEHPIRVRLCQWF